MNPYHAFVDADDIDYQGGSALGKLPVIVIGEDAIEPDCPVVFLVAPDGERYSCPSGLLYNR